MPRVGIVVGVMVGYAVGSAVDGVGVVESVFGLFALPLSAAKAEAKRSNLIAAPRKLGRDDFGAAVTLEGATLATAEGWSEDGTTEGEEVKARFGCSQLSGCTAVDDGSAGGPLLTSSCGAAQALPHTPSSMNLRFSESHRQHVRWTSQSAVAWHDAPAGLAGVRDWTHAA